MRKASSVLLFSCSVAACAVDPSAVEERPDDAESESESESELGDAPGDAAVSGEASSTVGAVPAALAVATPDVPVYVDTALVAPWRDWSWATTVAIANADTPRVAGSTSQIKATSASAWAGLALAHSKGDLAIDGYDTVSFDVRGPAAFTLQVALEPLAGGGTPVRVAVPVTTTWTRRTVAISALKGALAKFAKIDFIAPTSGKTFYVDNLKLVARVAPAPPPTTPPPVASTPSPSFPSTPLAVSKGTVVNVTYPGGSYALYVPQSYDASHATPTTLLLWSHGCGGNAYGDAWVASPGGAQSWITASLGGRDGRCWNTSTDSALVLGAIDDVAKKLNVDPRRVVLGGYSSGGDLSYRTAFTNARRFAGVIGENTAPFYGTGATQASLIAAAAWKLNVAHLAHTGDTTYPIARVRSETEALKTAGFPTTRIERPGTHFDKDTATSGTNYDLRAYLLPFLDAGWRSPP